MASDTRPPVSREGIMRKKVILKPGFHLTDWMNLTRSATVDISGRNGRPLQHVSVTELAAHNTKYDCWTAYRGKVYNISNYLPYHPGGEAFLLKGAGKDCTELFDKYHAWVNIESMLGKCLIGNLETMSASSIKEDDGAEDLEFNAEEVTENIFKLAVNELNKDIDDDNISSVKK